MTGFADAELTCDGFLDGRLRIWQPRTGYRAAIDPVLLAAFTPAVPGQLVLDLGCGAGTAALCLGARTTGLELHGLEVQPGYADLARRNATANGLALTVHDGDLRRPPQALRGRTFDAVLMNPPYHPARSTGAADVGRDTAQRESGAELSDWIAAGLRRLGPGGWLVLVHRADRLPAILAALDGPAGGIEALPVAPRSGAPAGRILVRARKGRRAPFKLHAPLTLHEPNPLEQTERYGARARAVLRDGADVTALVS